METTNATQNTGSKTMQAKFYHELVIRQNNRGRTVKKIVGSDAQTIDEAYAERCKIEKQYHRNTLVSIVTLDAK